MTTAKRLAEIVAVAVLYIATAKLGFLLAIAPGNVTAVWPPSGIALAAVLLLGNRVWPGIWLGSVIVNVWFLAGIASPSSLPALLSSFAIGAGSTLQALLGAALVRRFAGGSSLFERARDVFRFAGIEAVSCLVAATFGVTSLCGAGFVKWPAYSYTWVTWYMGDFVGVLTVTPLLLTWSRQPVERWSAMRVAEAAVLALVLCVAGWGIFGNGFPANIRRYPRSYVFIPLVVWAATRFGQRGVAVVVGVTSGIAVWGTAQGLGPFTGTGGEGESLLSMQLYMGIIAVTGLALAAVFAENRRVQEALWKASEELESRVRERTLELRASEQKFSSVTETAADSIVSADSRGCIVYFNPGAERTFGYTEDEILGKPLTVLMPDRYRQDHVRGFQRYLTTGESRIMGQVVELAGRRKDGTEFPAELSLSSWATEEGIFFTAIVRDITRRKTIEQTLRDREALTDRLFERAPDAIVAVNAAGQIVRANEQVEAIFGYARDEITGQPIETLLPERYRMRHVQQRTGYTAAPHLRPMGEGLELYGRRKDGREFPVDIMLSPLDTTEGRIIIAIVRDITRRKQAENELRESDRQLRALAARLDQVREEERTRIAREIHDELGQSLTGLKMDLAWTNKLLEKPKKPAAPVLREKIAAMMKLIDLTVQSVRRISSELRPGVLDDLGLLSAIEWQANEFQQRSGTACDVSIAADKRPVPPEISTAVFRIFQEILTNVARHAKATHVQVGLSKTGDQLVLEVHDNGRGVTPQELGDRRSLGLLGMRERAETFGGTVKITGVAGQGTTVVVTIPLAPGAEP